MHVVYEKLRLSTSISGPSLLEEMYRQHLDDMRPTVSTVDAWYTNAALPRISGLTFVTMLISNWHADLPFSRYSRSNGFLEAQKPTPLPFWSRIQWPLKISAPKGETFCPDDRSTVMQTNVHANLWHHR